MASKTDTVVLIHGLWLTARSWEQWADRYSDHGFNVIADSWPGLEAEVEELRLDPTPIVNQRIELIVDHYARIIRGLDRPPIIMGHSLGGAFTQILLDRGLGAAGVAISSAAVRGVRRLPLSTLRSEWPVLRNPLNINRAVPLTLRQFRYRFTNHLTVDDSALIYQRYCIPGAGRVLFQAALADFNRRSATAVDFRNNQRPPLLFIAGGIDHVSPPSLNRSNYKRYRRSEGLTAYNEFADRSHHTLGQKRWEEVADHALTWAIEPTSR